MNILSLFDGMSCGQIAMNKLGVKVDNYYASEIDKPAIQVTSHNFPNTQHMGDVEKWKEWDIDWASIDLVIAGSPCQGFSFAGKQLAFDDPRSKLFFTFVDILNNIQEFNPDVKFLLENVKMKKEHLQVITDTLGVEPVFINSALVSAQNRQRWYWANWEFGQPEDKGINLVDVLEDGEVDRDKALCLTARYGGIQGSQDYMRRRYFKKSICQIVKCGAMRGRYIVDGKRSDIGSLKGKTTQRIEIRKDSKTNCLTTVQKDNLVVFPESGQQHFRIDEVDFRPLTPLECERLQTVPENYTSCVSKTQRYKMLGNGWTVDVVAHIFEQGGFKNELLDNLF